MVMHGDPDTLPASMPRQRYTTSPMKCQRYTIWGMLFATTISLAIWCNHLQNENDTLKAELQDTRWQIHKAGLGEWIETSPGNMHFLLNEDLLKNPELPNFEPENK